MEKLTTIIENIIQSYVFPEDGKEKYGFDTYMDAIMEAVKERDAFIIGGIPEIITMEKYPSGNPKLINNKRLIIRLKEQRQRAEESR